MAVSSTKLATRRWKPTPMQLEILEGLYCKSVGNPNEEQIYGVANYLRRYGEIQAKSVFYWFKNRKFNDKLHKRRRLEEAMDSVRSKPPETKSGNFLTHTIPFSGTKSFISLVFA
ncbi:hypothetical protein SUGI_1177730 [Cryptomeria japonica]|nr:hypothetical protein SUGI_1177730 [Cryptomeria japonica]